MMGWDLVNVQKVYLDKLEAEEDAVTDAFRRFEGKDHDELKQWQKLVTKRYRRNGPTIQNMMDCQVILFLLDPTQHDPRKSYGSV